MDNIRYESNEYFVPKNLQGKFCEIAWRTATVVADGGVFTCYCADWTNLPIGNLLTQSMEEIYSTSFNLGRIRKSILDGEFGYCKENHCNMLNNLPDKFLPWNFNDPVLPVELYLGIDENCNLKCQSCRKNLIFTSEVNPKVEYMLDSLSRSYKDFNRKTHVVCDGSGDIFTSKAWENFLYGDKVPDCWEFSIITNGNLVSKRRQQFEKLHSRFRNIRVSTDAGSADVYKKIRGGNFELVLDGLELMAELGIKISLQYVLQAGNCTDLLEFKKLANKYNAWFQIQKMDYRPHMSKEWWEKNNIDDNPDVDYKKLYEDMTILKNDNNCGFDGGTQWLYNKLVLDNR
jgi:MoaA/NifB/PqqE/SkfB family radical SAM enzyme